MAKSKTTETAIEARFFEIDLTDAERAERRDQAAEMVGQLVQARQDEKALAKQKKLEVEDLPITKQAREAKLRADEMDLRLQRTARAAGTGRESRLIDCEWTWREDGVMVLRRTDNGEEVEKRFATSEEIEAFAQGKLFGGTDDRGVN